MQEEEISQAARMYPTGPQIRAARALIDMSREELASQSGVSSRTVNNIENGDTRPNRTTLEAVMGVLLAEGVEFDAGDPERGRGPGVYLRLDRQP